MHKCWVLSSASLHWLISSLVNSTNLFSRVRWHCSHITWCHSLLLRASAQHWSSPFSGSGGYKGQNTGAASIRHHLPDQNIIPKEAAVWRWVHWTDKREIRQSSMLQDCWTISPKWCWEFPYSCFISLTWLEPALGCPKGMQLSQGWEHTEPEQSEYLGLNFLRGSYEYVTGNECECRHWGLRRGIKAEVRHWSQTWTIWTIYILNLADFVCTIYCLGIITYYNLEL